MKKLQFNEIELKRKGFTREILEVIATTINFDEDHRDIIVVESPILQCHLIFKKLPHGGYLVEISDGNAYVHQGITSRLKEWT